MLKMKRYVVKIKYKYYFTIDNFVQLDDALIFSKKAAYKIRKKILFETNYKKEDIRIIKKKI